MQLRTFKWITVIGNFICQSDEATRHPKILSTTALGISVKMLLDDVSTDTDRLSKTDRLFSLKRPHPIS